MRSPRALFPSAYDFRLLPITLITSDNTDYRNQLMSAYLSEQIGLFHKLISPEILEASWRQLCVPHGVLDVLVA